MARKFSRPKGPDDLADYAIDFGPALPDGDTLASVGPVSIAPNPGSDTPDDPAHGPLTLSSSLVGGTSAILWLAAGQVGWTYLLGVSATSAGGRTLRRYVLLGVADS